MVCRVVEQWFAPGGVFLIMWVALYCPYVDIPPYRCYSQGSIKLCIRSFMIDSTENDEER